MVAEVRMADQTKGSILSRCRRVGAPFGIVALLAACQPPGDDDTGEERASNDAEQVGGDTAPAVDTAPESTADEARLSPTSIVDLSRVAGVDPIETGERTRALVVADFDNDGRDDLFVGNPGDKSYILRNTSTPGAPSFETAQVLSDGHISWTGAAADFDNDGDVDLMVGGGGNECTEVDQLWKNQLVETGELSFIDVRVEVGLTLTADGKDADWDAIPTTGVRWVDVDMDGWLDLYVAHNTSPRCGRSPAHIAEINELWHNEGGTHFERITLESGLGGAQRSTRHPTILDYDNDGDPDIYDSNLLGNNVLYHNMFAETGEIVFGVVDTTKTGDSISAPERAFASCAADLNNDGWEDLVVLNRSTSECVIPSDDTTAATTTEEVFGLYHGVYLNHGAGGFDDHTYAAGLSVNVSKLINGVMGCQVGDLNGDGIEDVFVGNGGPQGTALDDLYVSQVGDEAYFNASRSLRNYSGEREALRTHGTVMFDVDGDHKPELVVGNGGPSALDGVREPNRIFQFEWAHDAEYLQVRLVGDGVDVNRDAIGSRLELVFELPDGSTRSVHRSVRGGNCFSADNGRSVGFGLNRGASGEKAGTPVRLKVTWPNGIVTEHPVSVDPGTSDGMVVSYAP
jgi:hypothetical protein